MNNIINTTKTAQHWKDSFLVGNGHTGAMVQNNINREKIIINDECLWSGFKIEDNNKKAKMHLKEIQELIFQNKRDEAQKLAQDNFLSIPKTLDPYEYFVELYPEWEIDGKATDYKRILDMEKGIAKASFKVGEDLYISTCFISGEDDIGVLRYETTKADGFKNFKIIPFRPEGYTKCENVGDKFVFKGQLGRDYMIEKTKEMVKERWMRFCIAFKVAADGEVNTQFGNIRVENAKTITVYFSTKTNYDFSVMNYNEGIDCVKEAIDLLDDAKKYNYEEIEKRAFKAFSKVYNKTKFHLDSDNKEKDVYEMQLKAQNGETPQDYYVLYYNYSRYLLIASGDLKSTLPANLQGIWCWETNPPWNSDFHTNINLQMNYWQADSENLDRSVEILTDFMEHIAVEGRQTARDMYGARGWTIHHCVSALGRTGLHDGLISGILPLAGAWMMLHMFEHYEYTQDLKYLKRIEPLLKGCCEFICDFLVIGPQGKYVTAPSASPENVFITPEGKLSPFTYGCTIDLEIIYITLRNYIYTSKKLNSDDIFVEECKEKLDNLMPLQISERYGTLQEWIEDYEEYEPGHRHTSHLVGLYPGDCIRPSDNELFHAAEKSVERRVKNGSCNCNWSVIWEAIFYARFLKGEICQEFLDYYLKCFVKGVMFNIFEDKKFQIDAVLGYNAVINEMLIQSYEGEIDERTITLLPALPKKWSKGSIENIRIRGGINADLYWDNGKLTKAVLRANNDRTAKIYYKDIVKYSVSTECQIKDNYLTIYMKKGESYTIIAK